MITITSKGKFKKLDKYFKKSVKISKVPDIELYARTCIEKLKEVTPVDSGLTADSWEYTIEKKKDSTMLAINNKNIQNGVNIALILEFGHATKSGSWVEGKNFIEPTVIKTYLDLLDTTWKEMTEL